MKRVSPDERLRAAASFVRQGAVFADIGTDHAYLPVFLAREGRIKHAYACDIGKGPLENAKRHIEECGASSLVTPILTDGLFGLADKGITDIAICGMGGELIADILSRAPFVKSPAVRLILQPMTRAAHVRKYLAREGFMVVDECVTCAADKLYFCLAAEYTGTPYVLTALEAELGTVNIRRRPVASSFLQMLDEKIKSAEKRCRGLSAGGKETAEEEEYLSRLTALREELR